MLVKNKVRGKGVWEDAGRSVMNAGNCVYVDGERKHNTEFTDTDWIYSTGAPIEVDLEHPASVEECHDFLVMLTKLRWADKKKNAMFLAGWIATAPICGALPWRSHAYLNGPAGAGKSTIIEICKKMMGHFLLTFQSSTTEAGLRRSLAKSAMPAHQAMTKSPSPVRPASMSSRCDLSSCSQASMSPPRTQPMTLARPCCRW